MCCNSSVTTVYSFLFLFHFIFFLQGKAVAYEMSAVGLKSGRHSDKPAELWHVHTCSLYCFTDISMIRKNIRKMKTEKLKLGVSRRCLWQKYGFTADGRFLVAVTIVLPK